MPTPSATATATAEATTKPKTKTKTSDKTKTDKDKSKTDKDKPKTRKKTGSGGTKRTQSNSASKRNGHAVSPKPAASPKPGASPKPPSAPAPAPGASNTSNANNISPEPVEKTPSSDDIEGATAAAATGENGLGELDGMPDDLQAALENEEAERAIAEELARRIQRVQAGSLDDLPPLPSRIVRIFTSSTFTGNIHENFICFLTVHMFSNLCIIRIAHAVSRTSSSKLS